MVTKKKTGKKVATKDAGAMAVPSFINVEDHRGDENVTNEDVLIPRLDLAQALSECVKKKSPDYIEGIEVGDFFNSLTREVYGEEAFFVPVYFEKLFAVWIDRASGGGFRGFFDTPAEAAEVADAEDNPCEVVDTGLHYGLVVSGDEFEQVTIPMSRSKLKASRNLNSLCRMTPGPRFAQLYRFSSFENSSSKGDYIDFNVELVRTMAANDEELYLKAEELYDVVKAGRAKMHDEDLKEGEKEDDIPY